jgi:hypothetical protein
VRACRQGGDELELCVAVAALTMRHYAGLSSRCVLRRRHVKRDEQQGRLLQVQLVGNNCWNQLRWGDATPRVAGC